MTSDRASRGAAPQEAYVWVWLPGALEPVVAGRIVREDGLHVFNYGRSWLERAEAVPLYLPELPLRRGRILPQAPLDVAGCLRDGAPDAWGRRVVINRLTGLRGAAARDIELDELTFLLNSGSDRIGALDFQSSPEIYAPREGESASLEDLMEAAARVERGEFTPPALDAALFHGTSIGGARPKALIETEGEKFIAKFSSANDSHPVVKAEYLAMRLAAKAGLEVAPVRLVRAAGRDALLVRRFDRQRHPRGWTRRAMVSALTLFGLSEMQARYASYEDLAQILRARFTEPRASLRELFRRMVFNILVGNTDDHARNHAAFWDGERLTLTPAYDLCPQPRSGRESNQAMLIHGEDRRSLLETCRLSASSFLLGDAEARALIGEAVANLREFWDEACDEAELSAVDRAFLWRRQILNPFIFEGYAEGVPKGL